MTPLHRFGEFLRETLMLIPLSAVRILFLASLVAVLLWVLSLPRERTEPPGGAKRWDANLKVTAAIALLIQIVIYSLL
jgi:hypothetical protein